MSEVAKHVRWCHTGAILVMGPTLLFALGGFVGAGSEMVWGVVLQLAVYGTLLGLAAWMVTAARAVERGEGDLDSVLTHSRRLFLAYALCGFFVAWAGGFLTMASCGPRYVSPLLHWTGLLGAALALWAWITLPGKAASAGGDHGEPVDTGWAIATPTLLFGLSAIAWIVFAILLVGSGPDPDEHTNTGFDLPWPDGKSAWVIQGNNTNHNHTGDEEYAWDFRLRCGTPVHAAKGGVITTAVDSNDGHGDGVSNNKIFVRHDDDTVAHYLHIKKDSIVKTSGRVEKGEKIAEVGNVGNSLTGHIHFVVVDSSGTNIPVKFDDVERHDGVPRAFRWYWAGK